MSQGLKGAERPGHDGKSRVGCQSVARPPRPPEPTVNKTTTIALTFPFARC